MDTPSESRNRLFTAIIFVLAFLLRFAARWFAGEAEFWRNSYHHFYDMAMGAKAGHAFCVYGDTGCATRPPGYAIFLLAADWLHAGWWPIVVLQALLGAGTVLCGYWITQKLFGRRAGLWASVMLAFYPYYAVHDTALHPGGLFTFLTALSICLFLRARGAASMLLAGLALALAALTTINLLPFLPLAVLWVVWTVRGDWKARFRMGAMAALPICLLVGGWTLRNHMRVGSPTPTSESGLNLWIAHNPKTFSYFPTGSIDESTAASYGGLSPRDLAELDSIGNDEVRQSRWFQDKAMAYIREDPARAVWSGVRKLWAAFGWDPSPKKPVWWQNLAYSLTYFPLLMLALAGAWLNREEWREHSLVYGLFFCFSAVTAVYWAHTSHRAFLDVYLCVLAAAAVERGRQWIALRYTA